VKLSKLDNIFSRIFFILHLGEKVRVVIMSSNLDLFRLLVEGIALVLVGILGITGNFCLIFWFFTKRSNFHQLMSVLAFCDLLYIISSIVIFGIPNIFQSVSSTHTYKHLVPILLPICQIGLTGSIYLTLAIAVERYTTVCHPFFKISRTWRARLYIIPILTFSCIYNLPKFFELQVTRTALARNVSNVEGNTTDVALATEEAGGNASEAESVLIEKISATSLRLDPLYIQVYLIYLNLFIHGIIPFVLLVFFNTSIYRQVGRLQHLTTDGVHLHQKEIRLTQISLGIVAVFIMCHAVKWVPNIWELLQSWDNEAEQLSWPAWLSYVTCISHLLTTFNCSVNFYIYSIKHSKREVRRRCSQTEMDTLDTHFVSRSPKLSRGSFSEIQIQKIENIGRFRDTTVY